MVRHWLAATEAFMGTITSGIGLVSGINTSQIIDQLMSIEQRPVNLLQTRIDTTNQQKLAYTDLSATLTSLRISAQTLAKPATFNARSASSSDQNVITATAATSAAKGSYQFQVARLVTAQQGISAGLSSTSDLVGAGSVTIEMGGGEVNSQTSLAQLNGGAGVRRGSFRITDRSGHTGVIDISGTLSLDDVVKKINTSLDVSVKAEIENNHLVLTDLSGQTANDLTVTDLGGGHAAQDLGIVGNSGGTEQITGADINTLGRATALAQINDGRGVRTAKGQPDFRITAGDGSTYDISMGGLKSVGDLLDAINKASGGAVTASVAAGSRGITLTDNSGGGGQLDVSALNGSNAAKDLGILGTASSNQLTGKDVVSSLDSVLLSSLRGGQGLSLGAISLTDRNGGNATVDLSNATSMSDVLDAINNAGLGIQASLKDSGNGIQLTDTTGGSGDLTISDVNSTTAAELGIAGTFDSATPNATGANLQRQWVSENTQLSTYNGGKGVSAGKFTITSSSGQATTIDTSISGITTIGDVIDQINKAGIGVTASINANGDGLLLSDTAAGAAKLTVADTSGRAAADLKIAGTAAATTIDGSFEKTFTFSATDTLQSAVDQINNAGFGAAAAIVNDGSGANPFRLSLTARNTGTAGRFVFDAGSTELGTRNLIDAQDAAVFYGSASGAQPLVVTSSSNHLAGVIPGVTLDLHGVSSSPVTVNITDNTDDVTKNLQSFVDTFNGLVDKIGTLTGFDSKTNTPGTLLGDSTVLQVQDEMYAMVQTVVSGLGGYKALYDVGITIVDGAKLSFDTDKFSSAYASDSNSVKQLFTTNTPGDSTHAALKGIAALMQDHINKLIDPVNGLITLENKTLDSRAQQFQDRITQLNAILAQKKTRLQTQFANMESALSQMQSQGQAISSLSGVSSTSSNKAA
jgi:flagellar hook-associated protein 2